MCNKNTNAITNEISSLHFMASFSTIKKKKILISKNGSDTMSKVELFLDNDFFVSLCDQTTLNVEQVIRAAP